MILGTEYLTDRGTDLDAAFKLGVEIESPSNKARIVERLGEDILIGGKPLSEVATTLIWFPCRNSDGATTSWICRVLPSPNGGPKFLTPKGGSGQPFIVPSVWAVAAQTSTPLVITEGPVKAMVLGQAGYAAIGLNGVWCAHSTLPDGKRDLRVELKVFSLAGRKVYICFDADILTNPMARHAVICLFLMLSAAGAEVYELTTWDLTEAKGIDDLFMVRKAADPSTSSAEVMAELVGGATLFIDTFRKTSSVDLKAVTAELANVLLEKLHRHQLCKELARVLGVPMEELKKIGEPPPEMKEGLFRDLEPWEKPVDGAVLANSIYTLIKKHVVLSEYGAVAATLWSFNTYLVEIYDLFPFLTLISPEPECGKTTLMMILYRLAKRPLPASSISGPVVYRVIEQYNPSLILDEVDTYLPGNDILRGILNSGHTREYAFAWRCHPVTLQPEKFSIFGAKAFAMIGDPHPAFMGRSIIVRMARRAKTEKIDPLRKTPKGEWVGIQRQLYRWTADHMEKIRMIEPTALDELSDRSGNNWEPLLKVAEVLGGSWPKRALEAAKRMGARSGDEKTSYNIHILVAVRQVYFDKGLKQDDDFLPTIVICAECNRDKQAPWWEKSPNTGLTAHKLGRVLGGFGEPGEPGARPVKPSIDGKRAWGYLFGDLKPVFERYIGGAQPPPDPNSPTPPTPPVPPSPSGESTSSPSTKPSTSTEASASNAQNRSSPGGTPNQTGHLDTSFKTDLTPRTYEVYNFKNEPSNKQAEQQIGHFVTDSGSVGCDSSVQMSNLVGGSGRKTLENAISLDLETYADLKKSGKTHDNALDPWRGSIRLLTLADSAGNIRSFDLKEGPLPPDIRRVINESPVIVHNALFDLSWLAVHLGLHPQTVFCTQVAARVLANGTDLHCDLGSVVERHLGIKLAKGLGGSDWGGLLLVDEQKQYAADDVRYLHALAAKLKEELVAADLWPTFELESKLIPVVVRMRQAGIAVERAKFEGCLAELRAKAKSFGQKILVDFGLPLDFNLNSPEQLLEVFEREGSPLPNTNKETLKRCAHPLAARILEYRKPQHALDTIPKYLEAVTAEGRIHGDFDSHGARTGRFTCNRPALQTVPRGALFRQCFIAPEGKSLIIADYSKMEVVAVASITQDPALREALLGKDDFYKAVGSKLFGKPVAQITDRDRAISKTVCLGFQYGLGAEAFLVKLRSESGIELCLEEAETFRRAYFKQFPGLAKWHAAAHEQAGDIDEGLAGIGRRRLLSVNKKPTEWDRMQLAINFPVQGGCVDVFKLAMVNLDQAIREQGLNAQIVLCVHDELILECAGSIARQVRDLTKGTMVAAFTAVFGLEVPCQVEAKICSDWSQK